MRAPRFIFAILGTLSGLLAAAKIIGVITVIGRDPENMGGLWITKQFVYAAFFAGLAIWFWAKSRAGNTNG